MSKLKNLEYHLVSDGKLLGDGGGAFGLVPKTVWEKHRPADENNLISIPLNCLLVYSDGKTILVDTGCGTKFDEGGPGKMGLFRPEGDLITALGRLGVTPADIDIVINTHLHLDHCGGNTMLVNGEIKPTYPNAEYVVQRLEYSDAVAPNERTRSTYFPINYVPLYETGQLKLLNGDTKITNNVRTAIARGHTRAHQVVILESDGETALFMADLATLHYQFERLAWVTAYDVEPLESIETKRFWQQWAIEKDALLIFEHDDQIPTGRLKQDGKRFTVVPVAV
jgi:glyoxylase-like metal-dependent hydrolase (beta-lactamase superfamily II)